MDIRCTQCEHIGPPSEVRPAEGGMELICAQCGHANPLNLTGSPPAAVPGASRGEDGEPEGLLVPPQQAPSGQVAPKAEGAPASRDEKDMVAWMRDHALEKLIPERGDGLRCRKCAHLVAADDAHCDKCGLSLREAERFPPGEAPWERPAAGKAEAFERARVLWDSLDDRWSPEAVAAFVKLVRDEDLLEFGIRKLRFRLVDHPDDPVALDALRELAGSLQTRVVVARAEAEASAKEFEQEVSSLRQKLLWVCFISWGVIFLFFSAVFWNKC